ncbi:MAG: hypothetical protein KQH53_14455 [Desulfarculaceae bacterium]|nr:hypothetical protein [Desulfarculaceae bacterium]
MKKLSIALLAIALLLPAGVAQAYAIYNHTSHHICILKWYDTGNCHVRVGPHSTHNGEHGAGLSRVWAEYHSKGNRYESDEFSIPKSGYARIYDKEVKIYNHHNKHKKTVPIELDNY